MRTSWRTDLTQPGTSSNGNGNGSYAQRGADSYTARSDNGSGYHADEEHTWNARTWRGDHSATASWASDSEDEAAPTRTGEEDQADEDGAAGAPGLFSGAFKDALTQALRRSPLYTVGSDNEEDMPPQPSENEVETMNRPIFTDSFRAVLKESLERQQAALDKYSGGVSDDEYIPTAYVATPYVPSGPVPREMSPMEEVMSTALASSQLNLRRLTLMKNEIEATIERESKQVERLEFAMNKIMTDAAYYTTLEAMADERKR